MAIIPTMLDGLKYLICNMVRDYSTIQRLVATLGERHAFKYVGRVYCIKLHVTYLFHDKAADSFIEGYVVTMWN